MTTKEALQDSETVVMKYYLIYEQLPLTYEQSPLSYEQLPFKNTNINITAKLICIVEREEIAKDFCEKNCGFYYQEVKIENDKERLKDDS